MRKQYDREFRSLRWMTLILSALAMIGSIGVIGFAIGALVNISFVSPLIGTNILMYASALTMLVGIFSFALTPLGIYSVIISHRSMIFTYSCFIFVVACLSASTAYLGLCLKRDLASNSVSEWMKTSQMSEYGHPHSQLIDAAWDRLHKQFSCCGVNSVSNGTDWIHSNWFSSQISHPRERVPRSCCATCARINEKYCISFLLASPESEELNMDQKVCLRASETCSEADDSIADHATCVGHRISPEGWPEDVYAHTKGCLEPLESSLSFYSTRLITLGVLFSTILMISSFVWFILYRMTDSSHDYRVVYH